MIAFLLIPVFLACQIYVYIRLMLWLTACSDFFKKLPVKIIIGIIHAFLSSAMYIGFFMPHSNAERIVRLIGNYWYGISLYVIGVNLLVHLGALLLYVLKIVPKEKLRARKTRAIAGTLSFLVIAATCIYGAVNARIIRVTPYEVNVDKDGGELDSLNIVLIADLHMGYNIGCEHIQQMVDKVNAQNPDLIVIAGDIFDNEYEALDDPEQLTAILSQMKAKYGVYAVYGNHDIEEAIIGGFTFPSDEKKESDIRMDELLENAGITRLVDEGVMIADSVYLYGRPDYERLNRGVEVKRSAEELASDVSEDTPIIVFEHEPKELQELADAGVDVDLCGHTHDGQIFPLNLTSKLVWENSCGYLQVDNMASIVTSGVGLYGPYMRVGTIAEICPITINFTK